WTRRRAGRRVSGLSGCGTILSSEETNHRDAETQRKQERTVLKTSSLGFCLLCVSVSLWLIPPSLAAEPLPNTKLLTEEGNLSEKQVAGMHKYLDRLLAAAPKEREKTWKGDAAARERFKKMLGLVDARVAPRMEYVSGPGEPAAIAEC